MSIWARFSFDEYFKEGTGAENETSSVGIAEDFAGFGLGQKPFAHQGVDQSNHVRGIRVAAALLLQTWWNFATKRDARRQPQRVQPVGHLFALRWRHVSEHQAHARSEEPGTHRGKHIQDLFVALNLYVHRRPKRKWVQRIDIAALHAEVRRTGLDSRALAHIPNFRLRDKCRSRRDASFRLRLARALKCRNL